MGIVELMPVRMGERRMNGQGFVIAAAQPLCGRLQGIFEQAGMAPAAVYMTGGETEQATVNKGMLVVTSWRLPDMTGDELAQKLGPASDVIMIVPQDYQQETAPNVLLLRNPISQDALVQTVRTLQYCRGRLSELGARVSRLERMLEERKVIEKAKGLLMEQMHLSEAQAHYHIQKQSMDSGRRIADIAREILEAQQAQKSEE